MQIAPDQIDPDAAKVVQRLGQCDHAAYLVGGCVRDLLLGRKPKDFDVATSATPQELRRLFRNCRIIGRRFRLAHIFFGSKIIETATFRANPREAEEDDAEGKTEAEAADLLIRRDNVFGTAEEDARRRDFTINGLFYNYATGQVIDYVDGLRDIEARLVRTIGDPDIRFREDPIRIMRAVKFAARCDLSIEPETYRRMAEHRGEISKCSSARVSEEFYRLLRAGAAKRSMELLLETHLLEILAPELHAALSDGPPQPGSVPDTAAGEGVCEPAPAAEPEAPHLAEETARLRALFWAYLDALDAWVARHGHTPSNSLILAVLLMPPLREALDPDSTGVGDAGQLVAEAIQPFLERLRASRRDGELARQILFAQRYLLPGKRRQSGSRLAGRDFYDEALALRDIVVDGETRVLGMAPRPVPTDDGVNDDEALPAELEPIESRSRGRRGRRRPGDRRPREAGDRLTAPVAPAIGSNLSADPPPFADPIIRIDLPIPPPAIPERPSFLGLGSFGGPWSIRAD